MKINTNTWNKIRYTLYTPGYDLIAGYFKESRKKSIESLTISSGDKVLIVGAGTGLDLDFLPSNCEITATDITPSMLHKINKRNTKLNLNLRTIVMDGQALGFENNSFDIIILHLILAVIPDPVACIKEVERGTKNGGQVIIFDKFRCGENRISFARKSINLFTNFMFSDITRDFETLNNKTELKLISDRDANFNGNFRLIKLIKELENDFK